MPTDKQINANRANSQKSTGPRTPEGKTRSSGNARRHRLLAESILYQSENPERFFALARQFYHSFQPQDAIESALVDMMVTARWRMLRTANLEVSGIDYEYELLRNPASPQNLSVPMRANRAYRNLADESRALQLLNRVEARLQRQFDSAFDRLQSLRAGRPLHQNAAA